MKKCLKFPSDMGMHIRIASMIAMEASHYPGSITVQYKNAAYNAKSILGLSSSRIAPGDEFQLQIEGPGAAEMMDRLAYIIETYRED